MPLLDEQTRRTDRRPAALWAWVAVVVVLCVLCVGGAALFSAVARANRRADDPESILRQINATNLQQAQQMAQFGNWAGSAVQVRAIDPEKLSLSDKHAYFRTAGQACVNSGSPAAAAGYYERFLSMAVHLNERQCRECHPASGPGVSPRQLQDELKSQLGTEYANAVRKAGRLDSRRKALVARLKAKPDDPRLNLLLYHLDTAAGDRKAAEKRADRVRAVDIAAAAPTR